MKMEELRAAFEHMGYKNIKTLLGSGNAVIHAKPSEMKLMDHKFKIEAELSMYFGYDAYVIVKELDELKAIIMESDAHKVPENHHHYFLNQVILHQCYHFLILKAVL